jgi:hypothetical protein
VKRFGNFAARYAPCATAPWLWLGLTYLLIAAGALVLYGGADHPGLFADSPSAVEGGRERDAAIEAWHDRYLEFGLPFAIAASSTTLAWMIALGQRWLVIGAAAAALILALVPFVEQAVALVVVFLLPAILLLFIPWQAAAFGMAGAALTALTLKPRRERIGIHLPALYLALSAQALFSILSLTIARGTFG